jgi:multidrug efflux pump
MMTSAATHMAAIPPALALGPGAETRGPMAVAIIGGLVISTALSLLVVPAFFVVADAMKTKISGWLPKRHELEPVDEEEVTA